MDCQMPSDIFSLIDLGDRVATADSTYFQATVTGIDAATGRVYILRQDDEDGLPDDDPYTILENVSQPEIGDWVMMARWGRSAVCVGVMQRAGVPTSFLLPFGGRLSWGSGDPNGVVSAAPGSIYLRTDETVDPADRFYLNTSPGVSVYGWSNFRTVNRMRSRKDILTYPGASTSSSFVLDGFPSSPVLTATGGFSNADASTGHFLSLLTSAGSGNIASVVAGANSGVRPDWTPKLSIAIRSPLTITSMRYWAGLFSGSPASSATPVLDMAAFRFDTGAGDVNFMACVNDNSGGITSVDTGVLFNDNTAYDLGVQLDGTQAVFLVNAKEVARIATNLPTATTLLDYGIYLTNLTTSARQLRWGRITIESEP